MELSLLLHDQQWGAVRTWFSYWNTWDEFVDKVMLWGQTFTPNYLRDSSPEFHRDLIKAFFSKRNEYKAAPRGFSKTTVLQLCMEFSIVNKIDNFIVVIEKSFTEASEVIGAVRDVLVTYPMVKQIYGDLKASTIEDNKDPDAKGDVIVNGVRLRGKGFKTTIRGLKSKEHRPSRIILDDVEEDEHINSPEQRQKYMDNYNKGIQPAIDINGSIKVFGTILHFDSLLANLITWHKGKIYKAHDDFRNGVVEPTLADFSKNLLWPSRWTAERCMQKFLDMRAKQGSSAYVQEFLNNPISETERTFKQAWLWRKDREIEWDEIKNKQFNGYAAVDVADSTQVSADFTGVIVHLIDTEGNHYRVHCKREKRNALSKIDLIFEIWNKWRPYGLNEIGVEKKAFEDEVKPLLEAESLRRQIFPIVSELKPLHTSKRNRIKGNLEGRYELGRIWTVTVNGQPVGDTEELRNELYNFPSAKNDDLSDAEAYIMDMAQVPVKPIPAVSIAPQEDPWGNTTLQDDDPFN